MRTSEIAERYGIDKEAFEVFLYDNDLDVMEGLLHTSVADENVERYVEMFAAHLEDVWKTTEQGQQLRQREQELARQAELREKEIAWQAQVRRKQVLSTILTTTGSDFQGYKITQYFDLITGDETVQIPHANAYTGQTLTDALDHARKCALLNLKETAHSMGCNAVIGVKLDYICLTPGIVSTPTGPMHEPYLLCVSASGNAVIVEKAP